MGNLIVIHLLGTGSRQPLAHVSLVVIELLHKMVRMILGFEEPFAQVFRDHLKKESSILYIICEYFG